jgi:hypothetical protein
VVGSALDFTGCGARLLTPILASWPRAHMPFKKFTPTKEQRRFVELMACTNLTHESMASVIHSPVTGKPISKDTLLKKFSAELKTARTRMQREIISQYYKRLRAGDWNAIIRQVNGLRRTGRSARSARLGRRIGWEQR